MGQPVVTFPNKLAFINTLSDLGYSVRSSSTSSTRHPHYLVLYDGTTEAAEVPRSKNTNEIRTRNTTLVSQNLRVSQNPRPNLVNKIPDKPIDGLPDIFYAGSWLWSILLQYTAQYGMYSHSSPFSCLTDDPNRCQE